MTQQKDSIQVNPEELG